MLTRRQVLLLSLLGGAALGFQVKAAEPGEATDLIRRIADQVLAVLKARRVELEQNPALIDSLVETLVLPHFDFERITQGAVGPAWRQASPDQQRRLVEGFKRVLIRTYAHALLNYSGQEIRYLPERPGQRPGMTMVAIEVRESGAAPILIEYRMHSANGRWQVYDVIIDHASLVGNYRSSFADEIRQNGIDGLIARLESMVRQGGA
ncbi:ABC transporter substrate-binding protein [Caldichromatium japonicum]|uniref:ABC transporter substrate-binding protein n=1 Tax=Caldichromatium japonicum TaxID=2699430 RepID=A0A6G7VA69_9GAMM|nr:ABC transporter substrate-binding protein [Caldichromatium japonicum]QIK36959.1 ABC transporter substrate-binding protein [Caldichromatium japonicum]